MQFKAEGFRSRDEFLGYWHAMYPDLDPVLTPVWVLRFELMAKQP